MVLVNLRQPSLEGGVAVERDPAEDALVEVDERLHRRDKERAGAAGGVEEAERREHVVEKAGGEFVVELLEQLRNVFEIAEWHAGDARAFGVDRVENKAVDRPLAEVAGDLRAGVIGAEGL